MEENDVDWEEVDKEIAEGFAELVADARDEFKKTGKFVNFLKIWDSMGLIEQEGLVTFLIEKEG